MHHILVVDDDKRLRELLGKYLSQEGYEVSEAENSAQADAQLASTGCDLMVLDVMMPEETGIQYARRLRDAGKTTPILMLTAMGDVDSRIKGLEQGADDYLPKPFDPKELLLRIQNILRRHKPSEKPIITFGDYVYHIEKQELHKDGTYVNLTSTERKLLGLFANQPGEPISREDLSELLNGISERSVDVQITRLRKKIEPDPKNPIYLETAWGAGYRLRTEK